MNEHALRIICEGCPKLNTKIKHDGIKFGVHYIVYPSDKKYILEENWDIDWNEIMKIVNTYNEFQNDYVPKFGKYEIEEFISYELKKALFVTKDLTDFFNMDIVCYDIYSKTRKFTRDVIKERLWKYFDVIHESDKCTKLVFKWKKRDELETE